MLDSTGKVVDQQPAYDRLINAEILLQQDDKVQMGNVKGRAINSQGRCTGTYDDNPIHNSIIYDVEFPDGEVKEYAANILAENMLTQVDMERHNMLLMEQIVDWNKDSSAVPMEDKNLTTKSG